MHSCNQCGSILEVQQLHCGCCGITYSGAFRLPRLARLEGEHQQLVEQIILAGGNLKEVAALHEISYPTLRKRLDGLIGALEELKQEDMERANGMLDQVSAGRMTPEAAARQIKELNGGL